MAFGIDASREAAAPSKEQKPGRLRAFGTTVMELLQLLGEAKKEEIVHGYATTDHFPAKPANKKNLDLEKINSIH